MRYAQGFQPAADQLVLALVHDRLTQGKRPPRRRTTPETLAHEGPDRVYPAGPGFPVQEGAVSVPKQPQGDVHNWTCYFNRGVKAKKSVQRPGLQGRHELKAIDDGKRDTLGAATIATQAILTRVPPAGKVGVKESMVYGVKIVLHRSRPAYDRNIVSPDPAEVAGKYTYSNRAFRLLHILSIHWHAVAYQEFDDADKSPVTFPEGNNSSLLGPRRSNSPF
jgi:hypothetical protein